MKPYQIALQEFGTKEIVGSKHNPKVIEYAKTVGHSWVQDDETAWCASFVGYCLEKAGTTSTKKLNARSYLEWGEETDTPKLGDIVVFWRGKKDGWEGHVAFYINETQDYIRVLGGNQNNEVNISEYPKYQLLGYRKVVEKQESGTIKKDEVDPVEVNRLLTIIKNVIKNYAKK